MNKGMKWNKGSKIKYKTHVGKDYQNKTGSN